MNFSIYMQKMKRLRLRFENLLHDRFAIKVIERKRKPLPCRVGDNANGFGGLGTAADKLGVGVFVVRRKKSVLMRMAGDDDIDAGFDEKVVPFGVAVLANPAVNDLALRVLAPDAGPFRRDLRFPK